MKRSVLFTATVHSHIRQFHHPLITELRKQGYDVHVAASDDLTSRGLALVTADRIFNIPFARIPLHPRNILAYRALCKIIEENNYDIIHCNTPVGGLLTRLAALRARSRGTRVLYMAHGFHFYHGAPLLNWLLYYPIEKAMAPYTDIIITINHEDHIAARDLHFRSEIRHVHGVGVDDTRFHPIGPETRQALRRRFGFQQDDFILLNIGELNNNKNQTTIIRALRTLRDAVPRVRLLVAGDGPNRAPLTALVHRLGLSSVVQFLGYRNDLDILIPMADVLVTASIREGLPLSVLEAMACGIPVIASTNRGHKELVLENTTGMLFAHDAPWELSQCVQRLYMDRGLREQLGENARQAIQLYSLKRVLAEMQAIFTELVGVYPRCQNKPRGNPPTTSCGCAYGGDHYE